MTESLPPLTVLLAGPRGFCAGVDRAIQTVEQALLKFGAPVYVRHEIVHNRFVVESLEAQGAVFVKELDDRPVIFSAHGVPKAVPAEAARRQMIYLDATCPLVSKVHLEAERHHEGGLHILLIGHKGHPEVIGTMGQLPQGSVTLVEDLAQAESVAVPDPEKIAYITQTTLSVDDTKEIVAALEVRFPGIQGPRKGDICYATTNRQAAVKAIAEQSEALLVIGAPNSSNSRRLVEVAERAGCPRAALIQRASEINWVDFADIQTLGLSAGASAPEVLVDEVIAAARLHRHVTLHEIRVTEETITFKLPKALAE
jgi:4-hydroxy-3-methylbut-2-en-1-yl diphosphate reductase